MCVKETMTEVGNGEKTLIAEVAQHCNSEIFNSISVNQPTIFFSHVKEKCSQALQTFLFWFKKSCFIFFFLEMLE